MFMLRVAAPAAAQDNGVPRLPARQQLERIHTPRSIDQELGPHIHAISDEMHREIHALPSDHQKQLEQTMQQREHQGEESRRPAPPATP